MWVGLLTDNIDNELEKSNLINEHAPDREPVPLNFIIIQIELSHSGIE